MENGHNDHEPQPAFAGELEFCSLCGTILPLALSTKTVTCRLCGHTVPMEAFHGMETKSVVIFNDREAALKSAAQRDEVEASSGPTVDRACPRCGHEGMVYATLQTRSADEGQTIFYTCPSCNYQDNENS